MSKKRWHCCVPFCTDSQTPLHRFPKPTETKRFREWVLSIGGDIIQFDNDTIYKKYRVCHAHFEEKYCCQSNRISNIAVPMLNLPGPLSIPKFTLKDRLPLRSLNIDSSLSCVPSTSAGLFLDIPAGLQSMESPLWMKENISSNIALTSTTDVTTKETTADYVPVLTDSNSTGKLLQLSNVKSILTAKQTKKSKQCKTKTALQRLENKLYGELLKAKNKLSKCRSKIVKQAASLKAAKKFISNPEFLNTIEKISSSAKILTLLQLRECKKKEKGYRFNIEEKIVALSIFKQSPKCYRFLRNILILPSSRTLEKLIAFADVRPGINEKIFKQLRNASTLMKTEEKLCLLLFDEMSLKAHINYNERIDKVIGFETDGFFTKPEFSDHVQVYMIRGLIKNYKKAVSYTFSAGPTKGVELAKQLKSIIRNLQEAGFIVVGTVCDQGTNNRQAIKILTNETRSMLLKDGKDPKENIIIINNEEIIPIYDPPHLLKCMRNNLITKNLKYSMEGQTRTAKWSHIEMLHKENPCYKAIRLIPKLTDSHVVPNKMSKMKVKYASQLFSRTVASNMGYLSEKDILPKECIETADMLLFFDNLFDSVNGSFNKIKKYSKPLLGPTKTNSCHHNVWETSKKFLKTMTFVNRISGKHENIPTINNWVWTLDGIQQLIKNVYKKYGVNSIWMRHLNQDPLENFFGAIRSHGCRNINPTQQQFQGAFTTLLLNNMSSVHSIGANCEKDFCHVLKSFIVTDESKAALTCDFDFIPEITITDLKDKSDPRVKGPLDYVSGYFARCAKKNVFKNCKNCSTNIISNREKEIIKFRDYKKKGWLCNPTHNMISCVSAMQDIIDCIIKKYIIKNNIKEFIKTLMLIHIDFDFINCPIHKDKLIEYLINLSCRFFLHTYTKNVNKILCGKMNCDDSNDQIQMKAKKHFSKYTHRWIKNKT